MEATHHARLQLWWSPVKYVRGFDAVLHDANRSVKEAHKMACCFSSVIGEHLAVPLSHSDEELVDGHGRVDSDFAAKEGLYVVFDDGFGCVFGEKCGQSLDTHRGEVCGWCVNVVSGDEQGV